MKKIFLATAVVASVWALGANASPSFNATSVTIVNGDEAPVKIEELPEAVKTTLASDTYKGWTATAAFLVKDSSSEYYRIELANGDQKQTIKVGKDGQLIK